MTDPTGYTHCPTCLAEYRAGFAICTNCGSRLVAGPAPAPEARLEGGLEFVEAPEREETDLDRFALEETPVVLASMVEEDVAAVLAALETEEIGARAGSRTDDGGVEIVVHAANVADAQAVLIEFTGDVELVDDIGATDEDDDDSGLEMAVVTTARLQDAGSHAARLRDHGIDVRIELPNPSNTATIGGRASIMVPVDDLGRAREVLGITR